MPNSLNSKLLLPALVAAALLALPAGASATLSYVKNPFNATVFVANDDGSGARKVETGHNPHVAPDGLSVAYLHEGAKGAQELKLAAATGGPGRTLMTNLREAFYVAWSPDSKTIAALRGPELGKRKLVLIDVATGLQSVVAQGYFSGFSFSPDGTEVVYSVSGSEKYPPRSDVFRFPVPIPGVVNVRAPEAGPADQRPSLFGSALGSAEDRLRQDARRQEAQVRPEERALPDEPAGQAGQAPHPHQGAAAAAGPLPDRLVGKRQPPADRVPGPGHQLRGRRQSQDRRAAADRRDAESRASSAPPSPPTAASCSASTAASTRA